MEIRPAETRECTDCGNLYSLNLFRLDGNCCRYCESGIEAPINVKIESRDDDEAKDLDKLSVINIINKEDEVIL